jgi:transposase
MAGRPTKLTPEVQARIITYLRGGSYIETAAAACGIHKDTLYEWLKIATKVRELGITHFKKGEQRNHAQACLEFSDSVEKALAEAEIRDLIVIDRAAQGYDVEVIKEKYLGNTLVEREVKTQRKFDWQAAAWKRERINPAKWGRKEKIEHSIPEGVAIKPDLSNLTPEEMMSLAELARKARGSAED